MKTIYKALVILLVPIVYYLAVTGFNGETNQKALPPPGSKDFVNFILNNDYTVTTNSGIWVESQLGNYGGALNFNGIQIYDNYGNNSTYGTDRFGTFDNDLSLYQVGQIDGLTSNIAQEDLKLYWERIKISRLCYGQRLVYEVTPDQGNTTTNYGFCYKNHSGEYTTDQGRTVIHEDVQADNTPKYMLENIYENMQHGDLPDWAPQLADAGIWYMKPMMRIDSTVVDNNPTANVVRIDVINFSGQAVKSVIIKARNFRDFDLNYGGQYTDVYNFVGEPLGTNLEVSGNTTTGGGGLNDGVDSFDWWEWEDNCQVDFKVYWYGEVDVWFDKMTVDDEIGNGLFDGIYNYHILDETTPEMFLLTAMMVKERKFAESNYGAVNYVMNKMYSKLRYQAAPITLK
jgi:hypothetical protein